MAEDISNWRKISERTEKVGWRSVTHKEFVDPSGATKDFTTIGKPGTNCVAVIALTKTSRVVVAKLFRAGPEVVFSELPGGFVDPNEDLEAAASREVAEETGYTSDSPLEYLGRVCRDGYTNDVNHYFLARNCYLSQEPKRDDVEVIEVDEISIDELIDNAKTFRMSDSAAVLLAIDELEELRRGQ